MTDVNYTPEFDPVDVDGDYGSTGGDITVPTFHDIKPFRFWCQKALPLVYDDSLSYYEVLCKVVSYLNNMMTDLTTGTGAITQFAQQFVINQQFLNNMATKLGQNTEELEDYINDRMDDFTTAYNELQDYVNQYFNNLDVQDEIDTKLDEMAESGQFNVLFDPVIQAWMEDETEYINTSITNQNSTLAQQNGRISVLEGRMDTFASLPSGSTSGNAELLDIRTNFLGETYPSAGDAVRASDMIASGFQSISATKLEDWDGNDDSSVYDTIQIDISGYKGGHVAVIGSFLYFQSDLNNMGTCSVYATNTPGKVEDANAVNYYPGGANSIFTNFTQITTNISGEERLLLQFAIPDDFAYQYLKIGHFDHSALSGSYTEPQYIVYANSWSKTQVDPTLSITGDAGDAKATGDALRQLNERLDSINKTVTETYETTGSTLNKFIPFKIIAGFSYLISVTLNNPFSSFSLYTTSEASVGTSAIVETISNSSLSVKDHIFTATDDAEYFRYTCSVGCTITITAISPNYNYNYAKSIDTQSKTNLSLNDQFDMTGTYQTNQGVGNTASSTITPDSQRIGLKVECAVGDEFLITGSGGSGGRLWCLTDSNYKILSVANTSVTETDLQLKAFANGYLIVNVYKNQTYDIRKKNGQLKTEDLQEQIDNLSSIDVYDNVEVNTYLYHYIVTNGSVGSTVDVANPVLNRGSETVTLEVEAREVYRIYGQGGSTGRLWCLTDSSYEILSSAASSLNAKTNPAIITVDSDGYLIINNNDISFELVVQKQKTDKTANIIAGNYENIEALQTKSAEHNADISNLLNIPLAKFDFDDFDMLDVSAYRALIDYDSPNRTPLLEQFYTLFDSLVSNYSSYVSRTDTAVECDLAYPEYANGIVTQGTYEVTPAYKTYMYKFIDTNAGAGNNAYNVKKKLLITCGTHGTEVMTPFNAFVFASELCKGTIPNYAKLRASFDIYIVPCLNGYGIYHNMRANANWVDINRNFPTNPWVVADADKIGDKNFCTYTGAVAGSEFETKIVMGLKELLNPDIHIDHHNYSGGDTQFYTDLEVQEYLRLAYESLVDISIACVKNYPAYFGNSYMLIIPNRDVTFAPRVTTYNTNGKMTTWMTQNDVPLSASLEIASDIRYNNGVISQVVQDWAGEDTFAVGEFTLRNQVMRYGQYVLQQTGN